MSAAYLGTAIFVVPALFVIVAAVLKWADNTEIRERNKPAGAKPHWLARANGKLEEWASYRGGIGKNDGR